MKSSKNIILAIIVIGIIGAILYIESTKPMHSASQVKDINLTIADVSGNTPSTSSSSSASSILSSSSSKTVGTVSATPSVPTATRLAIKTKEYIPAKELSDIQGYINSTAVLENGTASSTAPFKLADFVGKKVILLDFWTYSCINCLRTTPYLTAWDKKYRDQGLLIVGVHTPEFDFEKDYGNVSAAVKRLGINYPVALDSNYGTWTAYRNMYWPHEYLIDIDGFIIHDHFGEGAYAETEQAIQNALKERAQVLGIGTGVGISATTTAPQNAVSMDPTKVQSPETYFGSGRNEYLGNGHAGTSGSQTLTLPMVPAPNTLYLGGTWNFQDQFAENTSQIADIVFNYSAKNVYFVAAASTPTTGVKIKILIDGEPISSAQAGTDVAADGTVTITGNRLYNIINGSGYGPHVLHLEVEGPGLAAFTFTFG